MKEKSEFKIYNTYTDARNEPVPKMHWGKNSFTIGEPPPRLPENTPIHTYYIWYGDALNYERVSWWLDEKGTLVVAYEPAGTGKHRDIKVQFGGDPNKKLEV